MKIKWNKWQRHEVGDYGHFVKLKALKIVEKSGPYYGIAYMDIYGEIQVLYSHYSEVDLGTFPSMEA